MTFSGASASNVPRDIRHYRLLRKVGQGTFGAVYKAFDTKNNKLVAVKVLEPKGEAEKRCVQDEIRNLQTVHQAQPNKYIVGLVDSFTYRAPNGNEQSVIVLEYVEFDLAALLELGSECLSFSRSQLKCIMKQILEGLSSLASCGLMHRDLKVPNVLLTAKGHTKLGDLGSTTSFVDRTHFSSEVCTLWYRAPELLLGCESYDHKIDIWSAAVVFVELCLCTTFVRGSTIESQLIELCKIFGVPSEAEMSQYRHLLGNRADELLAWASAAREAVGETELAATSAQLWERLSAKIGTEGVDLLKCMFSLNPIRRPSAQECLNHPFFSSYPAPAPLVTLPNGHDELHSFELTRTRQRKEQQEQSLQLQQLQKKRAEVQPIRKLSPEHANASVSELLQTLRGTSVPKTSSVPSVLAVLPEPVVAKKPKKNLRVSFALERNQSQFYCPADAPCEVSRTRAKRSRSDDSDDMLDVDEELPVRPSKVCKIYEDAEESPFPAPISESPAQRKLPKLIISGGKIVLSPVAASPLPAPVL